MPQLRGNKAGNPPLPCGAPSHTLVALPGQSPSLDPGNSDLFKLGIAQLKQILGTPSRLPSFTCQGSCAFAKHSPEWSLWEQTACRRLGRSSGSVGVGWDAGLQPCVPTQCLCAGEISGEEREQHSLGHAM